MKNVLRIWRKARPLLAGLLVGGMSSFVGNWLASRGIGLYVFNGMIIIFIYLTVDLWRMKKNRKKAQAQRDQAAQVIINHQMALFQDEELPDRMAVNAALDQILISNGEDFEAMQTVMRYSSKIKPVLEWSERIKRKPPGKGIRGLTPEFGLVEIKKDEEEEQHTSNFEKTRIGQYKIWRDLSMLYFQHYWVSDLNTATNPLDACNSNIILFNETTLEPEGFGQMEFEEIKIPVPFAPKLVLLLVNIISGAEKGKRKPFGMLTMR